jgi:uncharacterized protein (TIRG00374 family)
MSEETRNPNTAETAESPQKTPVKSLLIGVAIMAAIILITMIVVFRQVSPSQMIAAIKQMNPICIVIGLLLMAGYTLGEALTIRRSLIMLGYTCTVPQALKYAMVGYFYANITPSASGGQPMQIYYMYHDRIKVSHGFLSMMILFMGFEAATVGYAALGYLTQHDMLVSAMGGTTVLLTVGIIINLVLLGLVCLLLFSKNAIRILGNILIKIISIFERKQDKVKNMIRGALDEYAGCAGALKGRPDIVWKTIVTALIQFLCYHSVPYVVYRGFGLSEFGWLQTFLLQAVLYVAVGFLPLPGAVGASEATFMIIFRLLYPPAILASAMVMTRSINLYFMLLINGIAVLFFTSIIIRKYQRRSSLSKLTRGFRKK